MAFGDVSTLVQGTWPGWEVVRLIGKGSYGSVYEIQESKSGKLNMAALKVISIPEEGTALPIGQDMNSLNTYYSSIAETMEQEYITARELKNAGCSNVVGCDSYVKVPNDNGIGLKLLIKMELLTDLNSYIRKSGFSRQDVIRLGIDICRALEICRVNHVFHRDIKPANLFVSADGTYKLGDFGVAKRLEETGYAGSKQGTILYMAPEVYANRDYDHRADLYSLGLVMYQLLNKGQLPFMVGALNERSQGEALRKRMRGDIIPMPATENGDLAEIVLRACRYDYRERYTDPVQMRWALEKLLDTMDRKMVIAPVDTRPEVRIRFMDPDGTVLHARNYRQGEKLMVPAMPKEKVKNGLVLQFEKWDPPLPETATATMDFSATYKKVPSAVPETGKGKKEKQKKKTKRKAGGWIAAVLCVLLASAGLWAYLSGNLGTIGKETPPSVQVSAPQKEEEKTTITLNKESIVLPVGKSEVLKATVLPSEKSENIIWASSLQSVAEVYDGKVVARSEGTSTITAKVDDARTTCRVTVIKEEVESIKIKSKPTKTDYFVGETLETTGMSLEVRYNNGNIITIGGDFQAECDMGVPGENKVVKVSFGGKETSYTINVKPKEVKITSISVATKPDMVNYRKGQTLQTKGLTLTATYDNGTTGTITSGFACTPTALSTMGQQKITVSYGGFQTIFEVSVGEAGMKRSEVINNGTGKTTYYAGETFDPSGFSLIVTYNDDSTKTVPLSDCEKANETILQAGQTRLIFMYKNSVNQVAVYVEGLTVIAPDISISKGSSGGTTMNLSVSGDATSTNVSWSSDNNSVVSVSNDGTVTAKGEGSATITASFANNGKTYSDSIVLSVTKSETSEGDWQDSELSPSGNKQVETRNVEDHTETLWGHYCTGTWGDYRTHGSPMGNITTYHEFGWLGDGDPGLMWYDGDGKYEPGEYVYQPNGNRWRCSNTCFRLYAMDTRVVYKTQYRYKNITYKFQ